MRPVPGIISALLFAVMLCSCNVTGDLPGNGNGHFTMVTSGQPSEGGTVIPESGQFEPGSEVEITALPGDGYRFEYWEGDLSGSENPAILKVEADRSVTAIFSLVESGGSGENNEDNGSDTDDSAEDEEVDEGEGGGNEPDGGSDGGNGENDSGEGDNGGASENDNDDGQDEDGSGESDGSEDQGSGESEDSDEGDTHEDESDDDSGRIGDFIDISIVEVTAPEHATKGDKVTVFVTVKNLGTLNIRDDIDVELVNQTEDRDIGEQKIKYGINAGGSVILTFIWDTRKASSGIHTLVAIHDYDDDENEGKPWLSTQIEIRDK